MIRWWKKWFLACNEPFFHLRIKPGAPRPIMASPRSSDETAAEESQKNLVPGPEPPAKPAPANPEECSETIARLIADASGGGDEEGPNSDGSTDLALTKTGKGKGKGKAKSKAKAKAAVKDKVVKKAGDKTADKEKGAKKGRGTTKATHGKCYTLSRVLGSENGQAPSGKPGRSCSDF